jgi:thiosulfate/3-mercaptopyruvate sulfurtransferase
MQWLVETAWLASNLERTDIRIVDIRGDVLPPKELGKPIYLPKPQDYATAHIPGAVFIDWTRDIVDPEDPVPVQIAGPERFTAAMQAAGIGDSTYVIAYDDHNNIMAGRLWWALRYYGHDKVAVLNGGWSKWVQEGRPVTDRVRPVPPSGAFTPRLRPELRRQADQILPEAAAGAILLDNRTPSDFAGSTQRALRAGHIPGAINIPTTTLLGPDGAVLPITELRSKFAAVGLNAAQPDQPIITYCNGGVNASLVALALNEAGFNHVAVYDGSWNEWGNDFARPLELGPSR